MIKKICHRKVYLLFWIDDEEEIEIEEETSQHSAPSIQRRPTYGYSELEKVSLECPEGLNSLMYHRE